MPGIFLREWTKVGIVQRGTGKLPPRSQSSRAIIKQMRAIYRRINPDDSEHGVRGVFDLSYSDIN